MSDLQFTLNSAEVAFTAATAKTLMLVHAPANHRLKLLEWGVYFDGTSSVAEPSEVELVRASASGTMSVLTPLKNDPGITETIQASGMVNATVEPTVTSAFEPKEVHPQSGYEKAYGLGNEVKVEGGGYLGIRINAPANVNARGYMKFEE